jgi:hypothetical protein
MLALTSSVRARGLRPGPKGQAHLEGTTSCLMSSWASRIADDKRRPSLSEASVWERPDVGQSSRAFTTSVKTAFYNIMTAVMAMRRNTQDPATTQPDHSCCRSTSASSLTPSRMFSSTLPHLVPPTASLNHRLPSHWTPPHPLPPMSSGDRGHPLNNPNSPIAATTLHL